VEACPTGSIWSVLDFKSDIQGLPFWLAWLSFPVWMGNPERKGG
jgi:hypothetical protein